MSQGEMGTSPDVQLLTVVGYIRRHGGALDERLIAEIKQVALTAKRASVRLRASQYLVDHWDPVPRPPVIQLETGPVSLTWAPSPSPTPLAPSSAPSTTPSTGNGHAPPSSSAIDALENL